MKKTPPGPRLSVTTPEKVGRVRAVSYTHLDVYKRQINKCLFY